MWIRSSFTRKKPIGEEKLLTWMRAQASQFVRVTYKKSNDLLLIDLKGNNWLMIFAWTDLGQRKRIQKEAEQLLEADGKPRLKRLLD